MTGFCAAAAPPRFPPPSEAAGRRQLRCTAAAVCLGLVLSLSAAPLVSAAGIYKWTDADGSVHYGDKPEAPASQRIVIPAVTGSPDSDAAARRQRAQELLEVLQEERQEQRQLEQDRQAKQRERKANCARAQEAQRTYGDSGRIFEFDEAGEKRYLSDEDLAAYRAKLTEQVDYWCR